MPRLGIAITTFNREQMLARHLAAIKALTTEEHVLVICDDGSDADIAPIAAEHGAVLIKGVNKGIAWNKNRGLFYLMNHTGVDTIVLLDDDMFPTQAGWEQEWIRACALYGHVTYALPNETTGLYGGEGSSSIPRVSTYLLGAVLAFHRSVAAEVGYMDTRFGKYGHEHTELTLRALRAGYGGFYNPEPLFLQIRGGLKMHFGPTSGDLASIDGNFDTYLKIKDEHLYRAPWRTEEEYELLTAEMRSAITNRPRGLGTEGAQAYLNRYPDVGSKAVDAVLHWVFHGRDEGRVWGE